MIGQQEPRYRHVPSDALDVGIGGEIVDLAKMARLFLDPWQDETINDMMLVRPEMFWNPYTERREHKWACFENGVVVSRQNGKGSILEARELGGLFVLGERLIIHSAHQFDTSKEAFERILFLIEDCPTLDREVTRVSRSHGEEGIEVRKRLIGGGRGPLQRLRFRTRTKGGGRGFTSDCLVLDEAMILAAAQVGALMPTLSARPNPQLIYTGSAGDKDSVQFGRVRRRGIAGTDPRLMFREWSANLHNEFCAPDCTEHVSRDSIEAAIQSNPGMGIRIEWESIQSEFRSMDDETFDRERLGIGDWPTDGEGWAIISEEAWKRRRDPESALNGQFVISVDTSPDRHWSCVTAVGQNLRGDTHVEITSDGEEYDYKPGIQWVVPRVKEIWRNAGRPLVAIDAASQAATLIDELTAFGIKVVTPNTREFAQSCGDFHTSVMPRRGEEATLIHLDQPAMNTAVAVATTRPLAGLWAWSKEGSVDITPLVAGTVGMWGYKKHVFKKRSAPWAARR